MNIVTAITNRVLMLRIDWALLCALAISLLGLVTMHSVGGDNSLFYRQLAWIGLALAAYIICVFSDVRVLRRTGIALLAWGISIGLLALLLIIGEYVLGARNRFDLGPFSLQPSDPAQIALIIVLAKYFARRHVAIADVRHILVSGIYAFTIFGLLFLQPDFGTAMVIFAIWLGMVVVSGIRLSHLALVFGTGLLAFLLLWQFGFADYQKERIMTFLHPLSDIQGAGYNAYQSTVAVGSGELLGKGIGYGTQSKLQFLPEYETDFIFAAFSEEWGFVGAIVALLLFWCVLWQILKIAIFGATNFETLFASGFAIMLFAHITIHIGMNIGLLPVTGLTLPFMSYGGSHLITEFAGLGILASMRRYAKTVPRGEADREFLGGL